MMTTLTMMSDGCAVTSTAMMNAYSTNLTTTMTMMMMMTLAGGEPGSTGSGKC
jgi:uncharacterized protein YvpB